MSSLQGDQQTCRYLFEILCCQSLVCPTLPASLSRKSSANFLQDHKNSNDLLSRAERQSHTACHLNLTL